MSHHKTRLTLCSAATLSAAVAGTAALAAEPPAPLKPSKTAPVSHNEQGNFRLPPSDDLPESRMLPAPVPCRADHNGDGAVTSADISAFVTTWMMSVGTGTLDGDFDGSGQTTSADISAFVNAWVEACAFGC